MTRPRDPRLDDDDGLDLDLDNVGWAELDSPGPSRGARAAAVVLLAILASPLAALALGAAWRTLRWAAGL